MLKGLDKLEKKQDVQEKYNEWRRKAERENHMKQLESISQDIVNWKI